MNAEFLAGALLGVALGIVLGIAMATLPMASDSGYDSMQVEFVGMSARLRPEPREGMLPVNRAVDVCFALIENGRQESCTIELPVGSFALDTVHE